MTPHTRTVRHGFTLVELMVGLILVGAMAAMAIPQIGRMIARDPVRGGASVLALDLREAHSMAARQYAPVRITVDTVQRVVRVRDAANPATIYRERFFGRTSEHPVQSLTASDSMVTLFPNGTSSRTFSITLRSVGETRMVSLTRGGQIRVTRP